MSEPLTAEELRDVRSAWNPVTAAPLNEYGTLIVRLLATLEAARPSGEVDVESGIRTMSEPQRYRHVTETAWSLSRMEPDPDGEWVRYEDAARGRPGEGADPKHRPEWIDDVPTGFCECGLRFGHAQQREGAGE